MGTILFRKIFTWALPFLYGTDIGGLGRGDWGTTACMLLAGGCVIGLSLTLLKNLGSGETRFHGPADVIHSILERDGRMPVGQAISSAIVSSIAISFAAPVGRYGPAVHLGASLGSLVGQWLKIGRSGVQTLLAAGVAAAIGASFDAPIAGVLFAHEVMIGHFALRAFAPVTVAAIVGTAVARAWHYDYFLLSGHSAEVPFELPQLPWFALIGLAGGFLSIGLMWTTIHCGRLATSLKIPIPLQPVLAMAITAGIAAFAPEILGLGEELVGTSMAMTPVTDHLGAGALALLGLAAAKLVASAACLGLRIPGGIFAPALFIGTMLGSAAAQVIDAPYAICTLVGMGAVISSVVGAPLATILIVFELTGNYEAATAAMVGVVVANAVVTRVFARSFFHRQLREWKVNLDRSPEARLLSRRTVSEIMLDKPVSILPEASFEEVQKLAAANDGLEVFLTDKDGRLTHLIQPCDLLARWDTPPEELQNLKAHDLAKPLRGYLAADMSLRVALKGVQNFRGVALPIVRDTDSMQLVGQVTEADFIRAYNDAVSEAHAERS